MNRGNDGLKAISILGRVPIACQHPTWQGEYRFQAWDDAGIELDLTMAEEQVPIFGGIAQGFITLHDRGGVADQLSAVIAGWKQPEFEAIALDGGTWAWLLWLYGRLQHEQRFAVRAGVLDTLMNRVVPLLGGRWHSAESDLSSDEILRIHDAVPRSSDPAELSRSLRKTALAYDWALDGWAARNAVEKQRHRLQWSPWRG